MLFYTPAHARVGDVIPFYDEGVYHPFYLKNWNNYDAEDRTLGWHMLSTNDHLRYVERAANIRGGTGSVIRVGDMYHVFYCVFERNPQRQYICHAVSEDGMRTWTDRPEERFGPDEALYLPTDWRDPYVFWNEDEGKWWMIICALAAGPTMRRGCVGLCTSDDLIHWTCEAPLYAPGASMGAYECPDLFQIGDWWYLVFSQFTDGFKTAYRMSRSPRGPWITPSDDAFDGRAFYAAKTGFDGARRYLYGWCPTKLGNGWRFNPGDYERYDYHTFDWGGSLVVHELHQMPDGRLGAGPIQDVDRALTVNNRLKWQPLNGDWRIDANEINVSTPQKYASLLSWNDVPGICKFSCEFSFVEGTESVAIALQVDEKFTRGYYFVFEPNRCRVQFKSAIRMHGMGGWTFPYEVELERPLDLVAGRVYRVKLFVERSLMLLYVNDEVALCARGYDYHDRRFGLAVSDGAAVFSHIELKTDAKGEG